MQKLASLSLSRAEVDGFHEQGYLVLPELLLHDVVARLKSEADWWVDSGLRARSIESAVDFATYGIPRVIELDMKAHGELVAFAPLMAILEQLMGSAFVFHHLHSDRRAPGSAGKEWHHDYEQRPQRDRSHVMVHAMHYVDGLDPQIGGLSVLPGSHREVHEKGAWAHLGTSELLGEVLIDDLPPGSTVVLHSALFHARRSSSIRAQRPRYMIDASYCECGVLWPTVKPYWRFMLQRARELELGGWRWPELFADEHFGELQGSPR